MNFNGYKLVMVCIAETWEIIRNSNLMMPKKVSKTLKQTGYSYCNSAVLINFIWWSNIVRTTLYGAAGPGAVTFRKDSSHFGRRGL